MLATRHLAHKYFFVRKVWFFAQSSQSLHNEFKIPLNLKWNNINFKPNNLHISHESHQTQTVIRESKTSRMTGSYWLVIGWSSHLCFVNHCEVFKTKNLSCLYLYLIDYQIRYWLRLSNDLGHVGPWLSLVTALVFHIFSAFLTLLVSSHL